MIEKPDNDQLNQKIKDLEKSLESYRALVDNAQDLHYRTDLEGRISYISPSVYQLSGFTVEEAIGMQMAEEVYLVPEERQGFLTKLREQGHVTNFEARLKRKDKSIWWASTNAHFFKDKDGKILGVEGVTRDISELKSATEALRQSEERFRLAFLASPDAINLTRFSDGMYIDINNGFTEVMGYTREDIIGKTSISLNIWANPGDRKKLIRNLSNYGYVENMEAKFLSKDGDTKIGLLSARIIEISGEKIIQAITRDISDRKRLERQFQQAQKFEALGTLAGGIAHDFNNILMGIQGRASLLGVHIKSDDPLYEHVHGIEEYVNSATNLTKQLLGVAHGGKYEIRPVNIIEITDKNAEMFGRTHKEIRIHTKSPQEELIIEADKGQIEQVLLNLFINAWQAMPDGGDLFLETSIAQMDKVSCQPHGVEPGPYCKISVTDTGIGMDEVTKRQVFDPFFTTKTKGRGTGLGLASTYGIVKSHNGFINVYSESGHGTTFNLYFPLSSKKVHKEYIAQGKLTKGTETILMVDDESMVIEVGRAMLETLGYEVLTCLDGQQALEAISNHENSIDLVILDLIMPGMDGGKTFDSIRAVRPSLPVMLSSGYSLNGQATEIMSRGCNGFIQKPFTIIDLSQKIREILDSSS